MALRHVNVVERVFGLSNRCATGDADALTELVGAYHDDARIDSYLSDGAVAERAERAEAAIRNYFDDVVTSYEEWQCMLDYVQDYGDRVLVLGALRAVQGGAAREQAVGWIFTFRDDKIAAVTGYPSYGDALSAVTSRSLPAPG